MAYGPDPGRMIHRVTINAPANAADAKGGAVLTTNAGNTRFAYVRKRSQAEVQRGGGLENVGDYEVMMYYDGSDIHNAVKTITGNGAANNPLGSRTVDVVAYDGDLYRGAVVMGLLSKDG